MVKIEAVVYVLLVVFLAKGTAIPLTDDDGISAEAYSEEIRKQLDNPREQTARNSRNTDPGTQELDHTSKGCVVGSALKISIL